MQWKLIHASHKWFCSNKYPGGVLYINNTGYPAFEYCFWFAQLLARQHWKNIFITGIKSKHINLSTICFLIFHMFSSFMMWCHKAPLSFKGKQKEQPVKCGKLLGTWEIIIGTRQSNLTSYNFLTLYYCLLDST